MTTKALSGSNTSAMKQHNLRAVLFHLLRDGVSSRANLAEKTQLSNTAVGNLVAELIEDDILSEKIEQPSSKLNGRHEQRGVGRPRTALRLSPNARFAVGVHIGIGVLRASVTNLFGESVCDKIVNYDIASSSPRVLSQIERLVESTIVKSKIERRRVVGVGIGASGLVDHITGVNVLAPALGWHNVPLRDDLSQRLKLPVVVDNNVRAMALGESMFGAGRGAQSLAFVYGRVGVGAGFVVNGQLFRGSGAGAGEIGHSVIAHNGKPLELEQVLSERVLIEEATRLAKSKPRGILARHLLREEDKMIERIFNAARAGDTAVSELIASKATHLGFALANIVNAFNPELIVLGGMFVDGSDLFLPVAESTMRKHSFAGLGSRVRVQPTSFGWRAGVIGAASLALATIFYQIE
jgi:predicted NBD/HSP70 family sugar kinase